MISSEYILLDSGDGERLEAIGPLRLRRPSKRSVWKRRLPQQIWNSADAQYQHNTSGWNFSSGAPVDTSVCIPFFDNVSVQCRLLDNGQTGFFPEHFGYFNEIASFCAKISPPVRVLNLFGYTGALTAALASRVPDAEIVHVDISRKVVGWCRENIERNGLKEKNIRYITEDAVTYTQRCARRNDQFDVIIADPPGFSRGAGKGRKSADKGVTIDTILPDVLGASVRLLKRDSPALLVITAHQPELSPPTLGNVVYDYFQLSGRSLTRLEYRSLLIRESLQEGYTFERALDCGSMVIVESV